MDRLIEIRLKQLNATYHEMKEEKLERVKLKYVECNRVRPQMGIVELLLLENKLQEYHHSAFQHVNDRDPAYKNWMKMSEELSK